MSRRAIAATVLATLALSIAPALASAAAPPTELFVSEYIEGSSNNKAIEIYNGTAAPVDLAEYALQVYFNGSATASLTLALAGTVASGDVFVVAHASADPAILAQADLTTGSGLWNGDDAIVLVHAGVPVDSLGQVGVDPGTEWTGGGADDTLRRTEAICAGDPVATDAFDASAQFVAFPVNTFDGLGSHTATCDGGGGEDAAPTVASTAPASGTTGVSGASALTVTFSEPVDQAGAFALDCAGPVAVTVTGGPTTWTIDPDADLAAGASCTLTVTGALVADQDLVDPPDAMADDATVTFTVASGPTLISAIQGSGETSPLAGQAVTIEGVVVGDYEGPSPALRGFYVQEQDADADADPATSEGIFVFNGAAYSVALGDVVTVTGTVGEFQGQTQLSSVTAIAVGATGQAVTPAAVALPLASVTAPEAVEGMLVTFAQPLYVTEYFQLGRFGEILLSGTARLPQPTAVAEPGAAAGAVQAANDLNQIMMDDALQNQNADPIVFGGGGNPLTATNPIRGGDSITGLTGVMTYTWGGASASPNTYRVRPVGDLSDAGLVPGGVVPVFTSENPRPTEPLPVGGSLQVASFNVLNYFLTLDNNTLACGPEGFKQECRGAESALELERQRTKLIAALVALDADVVGLMELENTPGVEPAADIAAGLNAALGTDVWSYIDTGVLGTDTIRVGAIYRTDKVTPVGDFTVMSGAVDPRFDDDLNRPTLAQSFVETSTGEVVTLVMNHLKSKGSCPASASDPNADQGDGAGCWNAARASAAAAILDWINAGDAGVGDPDVVLMGDLNSYAKEDPIDVFTAAGYMDLSEGGYSYVFDGQWGYLDYALVSPSLVTQVTGVAEFHINADEVPVLDYNTNFKTPAQLASLYAPDGYRTSDHDPILLGLDLDAASDVTVIAWPPILFPANHQLKTVDVYAGVWTPASGWGRGTWTPASVEILAMTSSEADAGVGPGDKPGDIVVVDSDTAKLRAEAYATGGRTYTLSVKVVQDNGQIGFETVEVYVPRTSVHARGWL